MKVAFIKDGEVKHCYLMGAIYKISKRNFRKDWDVVKEVPDEVQKGWLYDEETGELSAP